ncbi:MAG: hypothetical protein RLZZ511_4183, partial [Cyanobacteriota bacterium]
MEIVDVVGCMMDLPLLNAVDVSKVVR